MDLYTYTYIYIHIYTYICIYVYTYIHIYTHTHIHDTPMHQHPCGVVDFARAFVNMQGDVWLVFCLYVMAICGCHVQILSKKNNLCVPTNVKRDVYDR